MPPIGIKFFSFFFSSILLFSIALISPVAAEKNIDRTVTNSIEANANPVQLPNGSATFRRAVALLNAKDYVQAYNLARGISSNLERRTIQWAAIYYGNGTIDYNSVLRFQKDAPNFASSGIYKTRMEQSLVKANVSGGEIISLLGGQMPNILNAQIALARSYVKDGQSARAGRIIKQIWVNKSLARDVEEKISKEFGALLNRSDHWQRAQYLLMNDRAKGVERIMNRLSPAQKSLARARIAVSRKSPEAQKLLDRVDPSMRNNYVFHFANAQLARRAGRLSTAVAHLDKAKGNFPHSAKFWYERRLIVRRAIALKQYKTAYKAGAGYTEGPEGRLVEANFHAGWVALTYLNDAKTAKIHFERQRSFSTLATSVTQANYWLGRALKALGDSEGSRAAFNRAAQFDKVYYGQLARTELGLKPVIIRAMPAWQGIEPVFEQRELVKAVRLLEKNSAGVLAEPLVRRLAYYSKDPGELLLAARLAQSVDAHNVAISIANLANRRSVALDLFNYPMDGIPKSYKLANVDKAAIYAVARQESRFDIDAVSRSGALGLMQLMPATAKETAGKLGIKHSQARLSTDPAYNALLGSTYLAYQMDRYKGSLVLAAASYNAGGGNVNKWLKSYGDPRLNNVDAVSWIETIPFVETRKYVQKVMANYMVYRTRQGSSKTNIKQALRSIPH